MFILRKMNREKQAASESEMQRLREEGFVLIGKTDEKPAETEQTEEQTEAEPAEAEPEDAKQENMPDEASEEQPVKKSSRKKAAVKEDADDSAS